MVVDPPTRYLWVNFLCMFSMQSGFLMKWRSQGVRWALMANLSNPHYPHSLARSCRRWCLDSRFGILAYRVPLSCAIPFFIGIFLVFCFRRGTYPKCFYGWLRRAWKRHLLYPHWGLGCGLVVRPSRSYVLTPHAYPRSIHYNTT